jgi:hypothetical protein
MTIITIFFNTVVCSMFHEFYVTGLKIIKLVLNMLHNKLCIIYICGVPFVEKVELRCETEDWVEEMKTWVSPHHPPAE